MEDIDHEFTDQIVCPWCGHEHCPVDWEQPSGKGKCEKCEKPFTYEADYEITYCTYKNGEKDE